VLLKRLDLAIADGDSILAVVKGAAMNNDGAHKASYMAPSIDGQSDVIVDAQRRAGMDPTTIGYVEAHGTATPLGDPIEVAALSRAFGRTGGAFPRKVALGAVKSNIGHTDAAAGVAGLIKAVLALSHEAIPPTLHFETPNPEIDFESSPFYVPTQVEPWPAGGAPRRAGISSFGVGGTNAHVVIEEAPRTVDQVRSWPRYLLPLSARTESALATMRRALADHLEVHRPALADVAHTLAVGRTEFSTRAFVVAEGIDDAVAALRDDRATAASELVVDTPEVVMMFPGQGSQSVGMGRELYEHEPTYRAALDRCALILEPLLGLDLRDVLYPDDEADPAMAERLTQTGLAQPAIFAVSYATAVLWLSQGITPAALVGHSVGEYVAATLAGVFALEDALTIIASRASLMQDLPRGSMRAVRLSPDELATFLGDDVDLAAVNTPSLSVVSGPDEAIRRFETRLQAAGLETIELHTSHAFHSRMVEPVLDPFHDVIASVARNVPTIPIVSTVTGGLLTDAEATDPDYWAWQVRRPVRFSDAVMTLHQEPGRVYLEVGPGNTLSGAVRQHPNGADGEARIAVIDSLGHPIKRLPALQTFLQGLGKLWQAGVAVDLTVGRADGRPRRVPLPTYPFERQRHWVDPPPLGIDGRTTRPVAAASVGRRSDALMASTPTVTVAQAAVATTLGDGRGREDRVADELAAMVCRLGGLDASTLDRATSFADLGLDSLFLTQLGSQIRKELGVRVTLAQMLDETPTIRSLAQRIETEVDPTRLTPPMAGSVDAAAADHTPDGARAEALVTASLPGSNGHAAVSPEEIEAIIAEQLSIMERQLDVLASHVRVAPPSYGNGDR
jgi:acyl transferase domain-containing protein